MKRTDPKLVKDIISDAINASGNRRSFDEQQLCYLWPEIVGPAINAHTTHRYIDNHRVLHVYLDNAALKHELMYMRTELCRRLNEATGADVIDEVAIH